MTAATAAFLALALVSTFGALLLVRHLRRLPVRRRWGYAHGGLALTAVTWLAVTVPAGGSPLVVNSALFCLVLAAIGGAFVAAFRLQGERPPLFMVWLHAVAAVLGLGLLLAA